jgi:protein-tyrosine phosphatase
MGFHILTICTGNICRSPMAAAMLRAELQDLGDVTVASAGTGAVVGAGMTPEALAVLAAGGWGDEPPHRARQLTVEMMASADLVLALTREHRRAAVQLLPTAVARTFTLREFGYIMTQLHNEQLAAAAARLKLAEGEPEADTAGRFVLRVAVMAADGLVPVGDPAQLDVPDPYGQPLEEYAEAAVRMMPAVESIAEAFRDLRDLASDTSLSRAIFPSAHGILS